MDARQLETWLWDAACRLRGPVDAPKYKDYILPLVFLKRLSDVFEDEIDALGTELGSRVRGEQLVAADHGLVRFYLPPAARWDALKVTRHGLGEAVTDAVRAVARANPSLHDVIDVVDFNATSSGQRIVPDEYLAALLQALSRQRLGISEVESDVLGRAYEYLLRKFAEPGASAGEFYTPREVGVLMARILTPEPGMTVYDPCCGSAGLLIKCHLELADKYGIEKDGRKELPTSLAPLDSVGQEINPATFAIARMNSFIHDMQSEIRLGDTMRTPRFTSRGALEQFDREAPAVVVANPMWNQTFPATVFSADPYSRFSLGAPPASTADWGWIQHMMASLSDRGRMAVVIDTGALARGSGSKGASRERDLRAEFVRADLLEAVIHLPDNLFYNTPAPGAILVMNKQKRHPAEVLFINATGLFVKGRPKNELMDEHVDAIASLYRKWEGVEFRARVLTLEEIKENDHNLTPTRYIASGAAQEVLALQDALLLLSEAEEERSMAAEELEAALAVVRKAR